MRRTSLLWVLSLLACARPATPRGAPATELASFAATPARGVSDAEPPRVASYDLSARLDPRSHEIHGEGVVRLTNTSDVPLSVLWFHLYLNAFKNERSTFMQEKTSGFRGQAKELTWGFIELTHAALETDGGEVDLLPRRRPPGEGSGDETELALELPEALPVGKTLQLRLGWTSRLPSVVLRTGFAGTFHLAGQWFPKLAKLEPAGFVHFPFHRFSEFYADFGDYRVRLDAPDDYVLGATGERLEESHDNGRRRETYFARGVHDFAFTAWDGFVERTESIDGIAVRTLAPKGHEAVVERQLATLRFALPHYGARYGKYPYPTLTVVHPPAEAAEAGGMEYPTFITTGGDPRTPAFARSIEAVTIHEFGHQYFYGLLASNEHASPFLDEGLNSFAEIDALERWLGTRTAAVDLGAASFGIADVHALTGRRHVHDAHVDSEAAAFPTGGAYGAQVYSRTSSLLETLRRVYGDEPFFEMLGGYTRAFRFRHPTEADLLDAVGSALGEPARAFLATGLSASGTMDVTALEATTGKRREPAGLFGEGGAREERKAETGADWVSSVVLSRRGTLALPVEVEFRFRDGSRRRRTWAIDSARTVQWTEESASELAAVVVDPERRLLIDDNWENNALVLPKGRGPRARHPLLSTVLAALVVEAL